jgi:hypothetical protein
LLTVLDMNLHNAAAMYLAMTLLLCVGLLVTANRAVAINKGADRKQNEL